MEHEHVPEHAVIRQLFQREFARMVAVLSRRFGLAQLALAEDLVGETFLVATEKWSRQGLPANPAAWLYAVANQKARHHLRRRAILDQRVLPALTAQQELHAAPADLDFSPQNMQDSQLRMLFAVCTPAIASEAQIGLALRILCGFGIDEIAEAFLASKDAINKRLYRAREKLRLERVWLELPPEPALTATLTGRLDNVLHVIYLLFNEGYYSRTQNQILRQELCVEALRLGLLLTEYAATAPAQTHALLALMCFHASRYAARQTGAGPPILYEAQDEPLWDQP